MCNIWGSHVFLMFNTLFCEHKILFSEHKVLFCENKIVFCEHYFLFSELQMFLTAKHISTIFVKHMCSHLFGMRHIFGKLFEICFANVAHVFDM